MKFVIRRTAERVGRLGVLHWNGTESEAVPVETPMCTVYTRCGHVPHLTHEAASITGVLPKNTIYQLTLPTLIESLDPVQADVNKSGIKKFVGLRADAATYLSYNDPAVSIQPGYNDKSSVSVVSSAGRCRIDRDLFEKIQNSFAVDCFQSMADADTPTGSTNKRLRKALDRTIAFAEHASELAICKKSNVFLSLAGGCDNDCRKLCVKALSKLPCQGYVFDGFHQYGGLDKFEVESIATILEDNINDLPDERVRFFPGPLNPAQILQLIRYGIDMFDSSYVHVITEKRLALTITNDISTDDGKCFELLDLTSETYCDDFTPISKACLCATCRSYTRAYMNHLFNTKEMLGMLLLMTHNLHQYLLLFERIRSLLQSELRSDGDRNDISCQLKRPDDVLSS